MKVIGPEKRTGIQPKIKTSLKKKESAIIYDKKESDAEKINE